MSALYVFTLSIEALVKHLMALLEKEGTGVQMKEIRWVLTVPAIWTDSAKQFMRKGAVQVIKFSLFSIRQMIIDKESI